MEEWEKTLFQISALKDLAEKLFLIGKTEEVDAIVEKIITLVGKVE